MRLEDFLSQDCIIPSLKAKKKREVLDEMVRNLSDKAINLNREKLLEVLLDREKLGSTGIGYGVAIPHARVKDLDYIIVSFGRSMDGIDFQSMDNKPAHLFFLIFAPEDSTTVHIKVLARISQLLKDPNFRDKLMKASSKEEIFRIIVEDDRKH
jgi:PTS system nitrogen regulatory IIA component